MKSGDLPPCLEARHSLSSNTTRMKFKAKDIAALVGGVVTGNPEVEVYRLARIEEGEEGALSFLANPKYTSYIYSTRSSVVLVNHTFQPEQALSCTLIRVEDAYLAFATLLEAYHQQSLLSAGISPLAYVHPDATVEDGVYIGEFSFVGANAKIGSGARIYPQVYVGDRVVVGSGTSLHPGVKVYADCRIGSRCTLHAGTVVGADGFGFAPAQGEQYRKVPQIGNVVIEDDVEIGANSAIDRATLGSTIIRRGVKLDNLIQVAHNVEIGENTVMAAQSGIAGSTKVGRNCMIAGQVGITGHITVADNVKIAAQSGVSSAVRKEGSLQMGSPSFDLTEYRKAYIHFRNLSKHIERLDAMEARLNEWMRDKE